MKTLRRVLGLVLSVALIVQVLTVGFVFERPSEAPKAQAQTPPTSLPLLNSNSMSYLGSFKVPDDPDPTHSGAGYTYGGTVPSYNPANNSLFLVGHDWYQWIGEISIPQIGGTASVIQPLTDPSNGRMTQISSSPGVNAKSGALLTYNNKFYFAGWSYYDGNVSYILSHFARTSNSLSAGSVTGPVKVGSTYPGWVSHYQAHIPQAWQSLLGGPVLTGGCCSAIAGVQAWGPAASVYNPSDIGSVNPVPANLLLAYDTNHPTLGTWGDGMNPNSLYKMGTDVLGLVFPEGSRSALFFGYLCDQAEYLPGGVTCQQGNHSMVWAYDANDLLQVKNGQKQRWEIVPYATWQIPNVSARINGATYDPATQRIYISEGFQDGIKPVIKVFQLNLSGTNPPPPPPPGDTTPPTVSLSAPAAGATVSGSSVTVSASASDNVGVAGVQFKLDGNNLGIEDTSSPYSITWNTAQTTNGSHSLTAVARDATGNSTTSAGRSVTVSNVVIPPSVNPIGHWKFDEGTGTTTADSSGNNNNGSLINGPTWTTGRIGGALNLDGVNDYIDVDNFVPVAGSGARSVSFWVKPTTDVAGSLLGWGTSPNNFTIRIANPYIPRLLANGTQCDSSSASNHALIPGQWNHVVWTGQGNLNTYQLYREGVLVYSCATNSTLNTSGNGLEIGNDGTGTTADLTTAIDDVRIYNRVLTAAEILSIYNTTSPPSNQPPIGNFDEIRLSDGKIRGWTLDPDTKSTSNQVHIYIDGPAGQGTLLAGYATDVLRTDVNIAQSTTGNHGFEFTIPTQYRNGAAHTIYTYGIDTSNSSISTLLPGSPKSFTLGATTLPGDINQDGIVNSLDWSIMNQRWFTSDASADLNHDGIVNSIDFSILNGNWFKTSS